MRAIALMLVVALAGCGEEATDTPDGGAPPDQRILDAPRDRGSDQLLPDTLTADTVPSGTQLILLHTNDLHEHLMGWSPEVDYSPGKLDSDGTVGGFSRLAALVQAQRAAAPGNAAVLLVDGGDFSMGTLFTWLGATTGPTLRLLDRMGYDAVALGNHELEWGPGVLAQRIQAAVKAGVKVPILASNMVLSTTDPGDDGLEQLRASGVIRDKLVKTLPNGIKVGIFGLLGKAAADVALDKDPVTFQADAQLYATANQIVSQLRNVDKVDLVICLSHSGVSNKSGTWQGEDVALAKAVPGIDVIVSGHTHTKISQPIQIGQTRILQTGCFGQYLGRLELNWDSAGTLGRVAYELLPVDDTVQGDGPTQQLIEGYIKTLDSMLMPQLHYRKVVGETAFDLTKPPFQETLLGNVITDAYRAEVNKLQPTEPVDLAIASSGFIRDEVLRGKTGKLWVSDLYRALPLGFGPDGKPGYPLVTFYLEGKEIKRWMEILYLAEKIINSTSMYFQVSGIQVEYDRSGIVVPLLSVDSVKLTSSPTAPEIKDSTSCYKVATTLAISEQLERAQKYSLGLYSIKPKLKDCSTEISDLATRIVDASPAPGTQELKAWRALIQHVAGQPDTDGDGIANLPAAYGALQGRIVAK